MRAAKARGLRPKIHADQITEIGASPAFVAENALSIDHLEKISAAAVAQLAASGTVATLLPAASFYVGLPYADARRLIDAGARVALATDFNPGSAPALDMQFSNLLAASQMRMSAPEILCACTFNAAAALGVARSCGTLERGQTAHMLLWDVLTKHPAAYGAEVLEELVVGRVRPTAVLGGGRLVGHTTPTCIVRSSRVPEVTGCF